MTISHCLLTSHPPCRQDTILYK